MTEKNFIMMNEKNFIIGIVIFTIVVLGGGVALAAKMATGARVETNSGAQAKVGETTSDWGKVGIAAGNVEKDFTIENTGSAPLKLFNVKTSCDCTTARLSQGTVTSPVFGMHTNSNFAMEVPPGQKAILKVIFDPAYHGPDAVGPVTRQITVQTNDPSRGTLTFMLTALVTK